MINFPNAKINIGLSITGKREDGYHNIASIFYPIGWKDALELIPAAELSFESTGLAIPGKATNNLILKAFELIKPLIKDKSAAKIHLHKVIPMGAGLGGGSADGAFALKLYNTVFELGLSTEKLEELAGLLGSDCPFFIKNEPVFCHGRGTDFKAIDLDLSKYHILVVNPNIHISTAEAYSGVRPKAPENDLMQSIKRPVNEWRGLIKNDFEEALLPKYPKIAAIKAELYTLGASYAAMTGSGSTVYGLFEKEIDLKDKFSDYTVWSGQML